MRLYLDSSALVKLYIDEKHSDRVWDLVAAADGLWTASVAYAEVRAAFSRRQREGSLAPLDQQRAVEDFNADWTRVNHVIPDVQLSRVAGELAMAHALRGFDAVHLACALRVVELEGPTLMLGFDGALMRAAVVRGLARDESE